MFFKSKTPESEEPKTEASPEVKAADPAAASAGDGVTPEQAAQRRKVSKELQAAFGSIVSIMMRTPNLRKVSLAEVEALVVPAVATGQFAVAEAQSKENGATAPVAAVLWACVSEEVDRKLSGEGGEPVKLEPKDWKSGDIPWLVMAIGDKRFLKNMLEQVQTKSLNGRPLKTRQPSGAGQSAEAAAAVQ